MTHARTAATAGWNLEQTYTSLPEIFFSDVRPTPVASPQTVVLNKPLAADLGLDPDALDTPDGAAIFAGNLVPVGARPIAQAYAGHQFGHFTTLGDGRAILLGEQVTPAGARFDIQWKGSGPTPYSRRGDGRAALGPMLREYLVSEALAALGIPTTRSLAVASTGEAVMRESPLPGAVLVRVAASHLRVGTFEWASLAPGSAEREALCRYTISRHFPELTDSSHPARELFETVRDRQARLIAQWQGLGFIHGVMNTDNMALSGETIDFGPCAFMDAFDPETVFSSIDRHGRYAYGNQPRIAQWNLARLAEAMLPLFDPVEEAALEYANAAVQAFAPAYESAWLDLLRRKIGLAGEQSGDAQLLDDLLGEMKARTLDWTNTFHDLAAAALGGDSPLGAEWTARWRDRLAREGASLEEIATRLRATNPVVIPRNHKVEEALESAVTRGDMAPFHRLLGVLRAPFDPTTPTEYRLPGGDRNYRTFCGT